MIPVVRRLSTDGLGPFAVCLTHDVDRPYKRAHQSIYHAVGDRSPGHLLDPLTDRNGYWQFDEIADLEADLGVRSAFYFLQTPPVAEAGGGENGGGLAGRVLEHLGRYDVASPEIRSVIERLDAGGWEVGVHGSRAAATDRDRLVAEVRAVEEVLGAPVVGGRQHHLFEDLPETWHHYAAAGLDYDATPGSARTYGFQYGARPYRPDPGGPWVVPLTLMEVALPDPGKRYPAARAACERLLRVAADRGAVVTVLFHPRYFSERDFPGYRRLYRALVERALSMGAWVGPPGDLLDAAGVR